jgi:hypothetical protein
MKVLILIQGTYEPNYSEIEKVAHETWAESTINPDINIKFYYGAFNREGKLISEAQLSVAKQEVNENNNGDIIVGAYDMIGPYFDPRGEKLIRTLEYSLKYEYDFVLRVCNTSYIRTDKLYEYLKLQPRKNFYDGARNLYKYKYYFVSGHNSVMSRDCAELLVQNKKDYLECRYPEDLAVGYILMHKLNYTSFGKEPFTPTHIFATDPGFDPEHFFNHIAYNYRFRSHTPKEMQDYHNFILTKNNYL